MIPKVIHYCWFGRNPLPKSAIKCISSWRKFFPDYEIKEWNEDNFDVNCIPYTRDAYASKKYAFVSDYARFLILYQYGGLYFDTDVEVIKSFDDIVRQGPFMGVEVPAIGSRLPIVAPGLGLGVNPGLGLYGDVVEVYKTLPFRDANGAINKHTVVPITTELLVRSGLKTSCKIQYVAGIWVYPSDFFNPLDSVTGKMTITENTRSIHWYMASWSDESRFYRFLSRLYHRLVVTFRCHNRHIL